MIRDKLFIREYLIPLLPYLQIRWIFVALIRGNLEFFINPWFQFISIASEIKVIESIKVLNYLVERLLFQPEFMSKFFGDFSGFFGDFEKFLWGIFFKFFEIFWWFYKYFIGILWGFFEGFFGDSFGFLLGF